MSRTAIGLDPTRWSCYLCLESFRDGDELTSHKPEGWTDALPVHSDCARTFEELTRVYTPPTMQTMTVEGAGGGDGEWVRLEAFESIKLDRNAWREESLRARAALQRIRALNRNQGAEAVRIAVEATS